MPISLHLDANSPLELLSDLRDLFPGLGLPPMQEQPSRDPAPVEPKERKPRTKKAEELPPENVKEVKTEVKTEDKGEPDAGPSSSEASNSSAGDGSNTTEKPTSSVPDIEELRACLKKLAATEGQGEDKVFEILGKYGAKNASTVPEEKRAACIAEVNALLEAK